MVPTWTRFVPKHYDITAKSQAPLPDQVSQQPFPFMGLPVEIRLQVYKVYLYDRYSISPAEIHEAILDPSHRTKRSAEILQVSKAINAEVKDLLQQAQVPYLQQISIYFMEIECAAWSLNGKPRETLGLSYSSDQSPLDI